MMECGVSIFLSKHFPILSLVNSQLSCKFILNFISHRIINQNNYKTCMHDLNLSIVANIIISLSQLLYIFPPGSVPQYGIG